MEIGQILGCLSFHRRDRKGYSGPTGAGRSIVLSMIGTGLAKKKRIFSDHSEVIVKTIDSYRKYLEEFEPQLYRGESDPVFSEFETPIKKFYNTAQQWIKEGKFVMSVKS